MLIQKKKGTQLFFMIVIAKEEDKKVNYANERKKWNRICKRKHSDVVHENTKLTSHQWKNPVYDVNAISTKINNRIY